MKSFKEFSLAFALIVVLFGSTTFIAKAQTVGPVTYGGFSTAYVPPSTVCPFGHVVFYDFVSNTIIGLAVLPGSQLFSNFNFISPDVFMLGTHLPTQLPCLLPYQLFPIFMGGTS